MENKTMDNKVNKRNILNEVFLLYRERSNKAALLSQCFYDVFICDFSGSENLTKESCEEIMEHITKKEADAHNLLQALVETSNKFNKALLTAKKENSKEKNNEEDNDENSK